MTEDRTQIPCMNNKRIDGRSIYIYQQWLKRFKQNTKKKNDIDIGPLIKEGKKTATEPELAKHIDFSGKLHNNYVTSESYILIGIVRYSKWPVLPMCKSNQTREVIKFLGSFNIL